MTEQDLRKLSLEELHEKANSLKKTTGMLTGLLIVLCGAVIFLAFRNIALAPFLAAPIAFFGILAVNHKKIKAIKAEIERRNEKV